MTKLNQHSRDDRHDEQLAAFLRDYHHSLRCDDVQRTRMQTRLLNELQQELGIHTQAAPVRWLSPARLCAGGVLLAVAAALLLAFLRDAQTETLPTTEMPSVALSFTADEVRQQGQLVCELERVFEHQIHLIHQRGNDIRFDIDPSDGAADESPRLLMRFLYQQRTGNEVWQTRVREDVIGLFDHEFSLPEAADLQVHYWSHLLPDETLWVELLVDNNRQTQRVLQCRANEPQVFWEQSKHGKQARMLVVYVLLQACGSELL